MRKINISLFMKIAGLGVLCLLGGTTLIYSKTQEGPPAPPQVQVPIVLAYVGSSAALERPPVSFDHDLHTKALKQTKSKDCGVCHLLKQTDKRLVNPDVKVFTFPKLEFDHTDKTAIMYAYHDACVSCHRKTKAEGRKTGPEIGLCGKCHVRKPYFRKTTWAWDPVFDYARHAKHVKAIPQLGQPEELNIAQKVHVIGEVTDANKACQVCHHAYSAKQKRLIYEKNTENSCKACHKDKDEKNARSMKKVAHAACIGCHMKEAEKVRSEMARSGRTELTEQDKKRFGPSECKACHGEHKKLTPDEVAKIPRLVRGQKDVMDLPVKVAPEASAQTTAVKTLPEKKARGMKVVAFNHKAHEIQGQFCSTCHHYSLEKCGNCHTVQGDSRKGGGITYYQAFHALNAKPSCTSCHTTATQDKKCMGCHRYRTAQLPQSACEGCHAGPSGGVAKQVAPLPLEKDKEKVPEKVQIKNLEKEYKPAEMPHMKIVNRLITISNENSLAGRFHSRIPDALCRGCHHNSQTPAQIAKKTPKCASCHGQFLSLSDLSKPGLQRAYHQQCAGCHQAMGQKPAPLECVKCHAAKTPQQTDKAEIPLQGYVK